MQFLKECIESFENMSSDLRSLCHGTWDEVSLEVQRKKMSDNGIHSSVDRDMIINQLKIRPALLVHIASVLSKQSKSQEQLTFAEVGTAQGMQSILFSRAFPESQVYTCDVKDDRSQIFELHKNLEFVLGDSKALSEKLQHISGIDFFWIDGAHDHGSVLHDFLYLFHRSKSKKNTIWAFDDYDKRFGCFYDLNLLMKHFEESVVVELGMTASGNANRIVLMRGLI